MGCVCIRGQETRKLMSMRNYPHVFLRQHSKPTMIRFALQPTTCYTILSDQSHRGLHKQALVLLKL
jgi:hypothetical protein